MYIMRRLVEHIRAPEGQVRAGRWGQESCRVQHVPFPLAIVSAQASRASCRALALEWHPLTLA